MMVDALNNYLVNESAKWFIAGIWLAANGIMFYCTFFYYYYGAQFYYLHEMLGYGLCLSRATAACINLNACLILLPMCRSVLTLVRSLSEISRQCRRLVDKSKSFHLACGYMICGMSAVHCGAHAFNTFNFCEHYNTQYLGVNVAAYHQQNPIVIVVTSLPGLSGLSMVSCLVIIAITASGPLRRQNYRRFWRAHHLFILFYALLLIHASSGILKYQSNTAEHVPGCYTKEWRNGTNATSEKIVLSDPEPHPYPEYSVTNKGSFEEPEARPEKSKTMHHPIPESEPGPMSTNFLPCNQPPPVFKSCPTEAWMWISVPLFLYVLERLSRFVGSSNMPVEIIAVVEHPNDVIEVQFYQKDFKAKPGQSIWLRCPQISSIEAHPFTLTSLPTEGNPTFSIHILAFGQWTKRVRDIVTSEICKCSFCNETLRSPYSCRKNILHSRHGATQVENSLTSINVRDSHNIDRLVNRLENVDSRIDELCSVDVNESSFQLTGVSNAQSNQLVYSESNDTQIAPVCKMVNKDGKTWNNFHNLPTFFIQGPYGSAMEDIFRYEVSFCVAGGIGITPFASCLNMILKDSRILEKSKVSRIYLVWACKTIKSFEWLLNLINSVQILLWEANKPDFLNVYLHVTQRNDHMERSALAEESYRGLEKCRLIEGRPNIQEFISDLSTRHKKTTIGAFCCGPKSLTSTVRKKCLSSNKGKGMTFVFNKETF